MVVDFWTPKATTPEGSTHSIRSWLVDPVSGWTFENPMIPPPVVEVVLTQATSVKVAGEVNEVMVPTYEVVAPLSVTPVEVNAEWTGEVNVVP
jgi:hypothetical protein